MISMSIELDEFLSNRVRNPKQKEFFDTHADTWDCGAGHSDAKIRYILSKLDMHDGLDVLDVGTGTGVMVPYYLEVLEHGSVTCLDYSERMIEVARSKHPESGILSYRVMDLYDLRESEVYDRVVCYSCFPHFPDPLEAVKVLTRSLRHGGLFCIAHSDSARFIYGVHRDGGEEIHTDYLPEMGLMEEILSICGLETVFVRDDDDYYMAVGRRP